MCLFSLVEMPGLEGLDEKRMKTYTHETEPVEGDYDAFGVTLEDRYINHPYYKQTYEEMADDFWAELAYADAVDKEQCELRCKIALFGYHTGGCPLRSAVDERMEYRDQLAIDGANGK